MDSNEFMRRRRQFMRMIGKDAIAILPAAPVRHRNGDIEYAYRQDSHFHYLTGFPEPEAVAVLVPGRPQAEYLLFVRERDPAREAWTVRAPEPRARLSATGRTTPSRSPTSMRSCRASSSSAHRFSTPWARTWISIPMFSDG